MKDAVFQLCDVVRETSFALHRYLREDHAEKADENSRSHRLAKREVKVQQQKALNVLDEDGTALGDFFADPLVQDQLVVGPKACRILLDEHVAQLLGYLRASRIEHGLLINFGAPPLEIRKYAPSSPA